MRDSFFILVSFLLGIFLARRDLAPAAFEKPEASLWALWLLMVLVGLSIGADKKLAEILRSLRPQVLLLPVSTALGTFAGAAAASLFLAWTLADCLAVGAGFGYYSLSSIIITQYRGAELGAVALMANILRELFALLAAPLLVRFFGPASLIVCGGCTTSDTTLPAIARYSGPAWILPAVLHAVILDFSVPFWVSLFCLPG